MVSVLEWLTETLLAGVFLGMLHWRWAAGGNKIWGEQFTVHFPGLVVASRG